ncbi:MAG: FHA domain-containing protein [Planctomycetota bacterium]|nr:FHA domain-containing protein [Planctomycetota bacterium]
MTDLSEIADSIDRAVMQSRLNTVAIMMMVDRSDRLEHITTVLEQLKPGAYLIGTGPSTVGIIPLTVDEVVIGRAATPGEELSDVVIDYHVADTMYLGPHEVSRVHAKIRRRATPDGPEFRIVDADTTCGTFVNGAAVGDEGRVLTHGDTVSLGPSHVSTYVFVEIDDEFGDD